MQSKESYKFVNGIVRTEFMKPQRYGGFGGLRVKTLRVIAGMPSRFILPTVLTSHLYEMFFF